MAADLGHTSAQYNLGVLYRDGRGVEQSFERAIELFTSKMAAANEDTSAQYNLGNIYRDGRLGVQQSLKWQQQMKMPVLSPV